MAVGVRRTIWFQRLSGCALAAALTVSMGCSSPVSVSMSNPQDVAAAPASTAPAEASATVAGREASATPGRTPSAHTSITSGLVTILRTPPATELEIPSISLDTSVEESVSAIEDERWTWLLPDESAAHHLGTANPGEPGNIVISGHVSLAGDPAVFNKLPSVRVGDAIYVHSARGTFQYTVVSATTVPENDNSLLYQSSSEQLTLITCFPDGEFKHRVVVRATPVT